MLAHYHGQTWNAVELGLLAVNESTVRRYFDFMTGVFMVREITRCLVAYLKSPWAKA